MEYTAANKNSITPNAKYIVSVTLFCCNLRYRTKNRLTIDDINQLAHSLSVIPGGDLDWLQPQDILFITAANKPFRESAFSTP